MAGSAYRLRGAYLSGTVDPAAHTQAKINPRHTEALTRTSKITSFDAITGP